MLQCRAVTLLPHLQLAIEEKSEEPSELRGVAAHTLKLPGKRLYLTPLLKAKKFRQYGYKTGALAAFDELQQAGLGVLDTVTRKSGNVSFYSGRIKGA